MLQGGGLRTKNVTDENLEKYKRLFNALLLTIENNNWEDSQQQSCLRELESTKELMNVPGATLDQVIDMQRQEIKQDVERYKSKVLQTDALNVEQFLDRRDTLAKLVVDAFEAWLYSTTGLSGSSAPMPPSQVPDAPGVQTHTIDGSFAKVTYNNSHFDVMVPRDVANALEITNALSAVQGSIAMRAAASAFASAPAAGSTPAAGSASAAGFPASGPPPRMLRVLSIVAQYKHAMQRTMAQDQQWKQWCEDKNICSHFAFGETIDECEHGDDDGWRLKNEACYAGSTSYIHTQKNMRMTISNRKLVHSSLSAQSATITYRKGQDKRAGREAARALIAKNNWDPDSPYTPVVSKGSRSFRAGANEYIEKYKAQYTLAQTNQTQSEEQPSFWGPYQGNLRC